jgi:hypothetical protein
VHGCRVLDGCVFRNAGHEPLSYQPEETGSSDRRAIIHSIQGSGPTLSTRSLLLRDADIDVAGEPTSSCAVAFAGLANFTNLTWCRSKTVLLPVVTLQDFLLY